MYTNVTLVEATSYKPDNTCQEGEVFVMVNGSDSKAVPVVNAQNELGAYWDSTKIVCM